MVMSRPRRSAGSPLQWPPQSPPLASEDKAGSPRSTGLLTLFVRPLSRSVDWASPSLGWSRCDKNDKVWNKWVVPTTWDDKNHCLGFYTLHICHQEVMEAVSASDVVVLCGETGCGKTTQVSVDTLPTCVFKIIRIQASYSLLL